MTADCTPETIPTQNRTERVQVNHRGRRRCHWTQRLKRLPTTRTRQTPHQSVMDNNECECALGDCDMSSRHCQMCSRECEMCSRHCEMCARDRRHTNPLWTCPGESPRASHLCLDATSQDTCQNAYLFSTHILLPFLLSARRTASLEKKTLLSQ